MAEITPEAKKPDDITNDLVEIVQPSIEKMIYVIRDKQVMLDSDLAVLYQVETGALNRAVKRNISRFPEDFRFQLTKEEYQNLRCQTGISSFAQDENNYGGRRTLPYVFTEQGISMLASVLHSEVAIKVSIGIMRAFVEMRRLILDKKNAYHIGASLKDAGKKCFGITLLEDDGIVRDILQRLELETEE